MEEQLRAEEALPTVCLKASFTPFLRLHSLKVKVGWPCDRKHWLTFGSVTPSFAVCFLLHSLTESLLAALKSPAEQLL